ncbi:MAG: hypothetical protein EZS28_035747 [Streblomastix strix]|uniref:DDE-1 domain-containing protein n=1 Tax=Streblomastix strix TaxID=222440 RepID=A0A5J4UD64_9EUKA|nr:MAG: hypothetical protein EZS28_035747 [Streblomastix strix]
MPHLPCSPDISPYDFWAFGYQNGIMKGKNFYSSEEVIQFVQEWCAQQSEEKLSQVMRYWMKRRSDVIE